MIRAQKQKVTLAQAIILVWAAGLFLCAFLLMHFAVMPLRQHHAALEGKVLLMESQLNWLDEMIAGTKDPDQMMTSLVRKKQELGRKFPEAEQRSLVILADYANKFRLQMTQIKSDPPQVFKDSRGKEVVVEQKTCWYVYTTMKLKGDYVNLIKYLDALNKVLPAYMTVERLEIEDRSPAQPRLEVNAELALYLLER